MQLSENEQKAVEAFKEFCTDYNQDFSFLDDLDWYDLSIGFFIAHKVSLERVQDVAGYVRYDLNYWV